MTVYVTVGKSWGLGEAKRPRNKQTYELAIWIFASAESGFLYTVKYFKISLPSKIIANFRPYL